MSYGLAPDVPQPGFSFDQCERNEELRNQMNCSLPEPWSTGTTVAGMIYEHGVILGADTRSGHSTTIDKNCVKIHYLTDNIYCCGAGYGGDITLVSKTASSQLKMLSLHMNKPVLVQMGATVIQRMLFRYTGKVNAYYVLGGVDSTGPHVYTISKDGSLEKVPYGTTGSGGYAAMSVFEARWKPHMSEETAKLLVCDAIKAGIFNDLGSGFNVDLCIIKRDGSQLIRGYDVPNVKGVQQSYKYKPGTTEVLRTKVLDLKVQKETVHKVVKGQPIMEFNGRSANGSTCKFYKFYDDA